MKRTTFLTLIALLACAGAVLAQDALQPTGPAQFDGERALQHVANHVGVGFRPTATVNHLVAGNIILEYLDSLGWATSQDWHLVDFGPVGELSSAARQTLADWSPLDVGVAINDFLQAQRQDASDPWIEPAFDSVVVPIRNLVASYGEGPTIIIGAHYDSRIYADADPDPARRRDPMPGANDGGSGVGVLLELARVISEYYTPSYEIRLVFFDAEDNGRIEPFTGLFGGFAGGYLVGSALYASQLDPATENIEYMLLVDLVGEAADQRFPKEGYSVQFAPELTDQIWEVAADLGYGDYFPQETRGPITDDHVPFLQRGIPAVDIIDLDYEHWHTTHDTLDKVSADSLERVGRVLQAFLERTDVIAPLGE